jgi:transcription elongation factor GreA
MYKNDVVLTKDGLGRLRENYELLKSRYKAVSRDLRRSIQDGEGRDPIVQIKGLEQQFLQGDIERLERLLLRAKIIRKVARPKSAQAGMKVRYEESNTEHEITLVDPLEADPYNGCISVESPIGSALLGGHLHDTVDVLTPAGSKRLTITSIG